ncbi:hypothetical protein [Devosia sp.]|uniref:hypothetical protein n=1 Tax=Devosia sp. TaxID=1871048 RepID=UPI00326705AA
MNALDRLATSLGRNDEGPNVELAATLAASADTTAIDQLVNALTTASAALKSDAIKTLCEIGALRPDLIAPYAKNFVALLDDGSNRLVWGAMTALDAIASVEPRTVEVYVPRIVAAADRGSVIAKDRCIMTLVKLSKAGDADRMCPILLDRLADSAPNQFPTYAEEIAPVVPKSLLAKFTGILKTRLDTIAQESKRKRVQKLLAKFNG